MQKICEQAQILLGEQNFCESIAKFLGGSVVLLRVKAMQCFLRLRNTFAISPKNVLWLKYEVGEKTVSLIFVRKHNILRANAKFLGETQYYLQVNVEVLRANKQSFLRQHNAFTN